VARGDVAGSADEGEVFHGRRFTGLWVYGFKG
jgi:hypothetical protein